MPAPPFQHLVASGYLTASQVADLLQCEDPVQAALAAGVPEDLLRSLEEEILPADRYEVVGNLGSGGMGEVFRVHDRVLNRQLAMKVMHRDMMEHPALIRRFVQEAQATAQLQHPGIVPIYERGYLPDGRPYYTMLDVRGPTLAEAIRAVHADPTKTQVGGWTFRHLLEIFRAVGETVAYAHSRGVLHRDLKPENILLGEHGEVRVVDWGLAKVEGHKQESAHARTDWSQSHAGSVVGTPTYMAPEQALGHDVDTRSDVYSLGAILYTILAGIAPYSEVPPADLLDVVPHRPPNLLPPGAPAELVATCVRAMARNPSDRFPNTASLVAEIDAWLHGSRRREQALHLVELGIKQAAMAAATRSAATAALQAAESHLASISSWEPEARKLPGWREEERAEMLHQTALEQETEAERRLYTALQIDPTLPEAHAALVQRFLHEHQEAEANQNNITQARAESHLQHHLEALPADHPTRKSGTAYLRGDGALSLLTDPPGAEVLLYRYVRENYRLVPVFERHLGLTPLRAASIPMGTYVCRLQHSGHQPVSYPFVIGRQQHWDGVPPFQQEPLPIRLPRPLPSTEVYVPAGWFFAGGDPVAADCPPRQARWCDAFVARRFPITNEEYLEFLNNLVADGNPAEALQHAPRAQAGSPGYEGELLYGRDENGYFFLQPDAEGDVWLPDWPVIMINWENASAYCRWLATKTGIPWRLPWELEWEKAARGVDGRLFPWGNRLDPSYCCIRDSYSGRPTPAPIHRYPMDESPYGVRGCGGNVQDWCNDAYRREGPLTPGDLSYSSDRRAIRGGGWAGLSRHSRCCNRMGNLPGYRLAYLGFRMVYSWDDR